MLFRSNRCAYCLAAHTYIASQMAKLDAREIAANRAGTQAGGGGWQRYLGLFQRAQVSVEARHLKNRIDLLVHERQRQEILKDIGADPYVD